MCIRSMARYAFALFVVLAANGCSLLFVEGPPAGYEGMDYFTCTESRILPTLDAAWAGVHLLGAVTAEDDMFSSKGGQVAVALGLAAVSGFSAVSGFKKVNRCRAARLELVRRSDQASLERVPDLRLVPSVEIPGPLGESQSRKR